MAYNLEKWIENEGPVRRKLWLRWAYTAPLVLAPAAFLIGARDGFGSPALAGWESWLWLLAFVAFMLQLVSPFYRDFWRAHKWWRSGDRSALDEREQYIVDRAMIAAFSVLLASLLGMFLYTWMALRWNWWLPGADDLGSGFRLFIVTMPSLPIVFAEWMTPLPPEDEEE